VTSLVFDPAYKEGDDHSFTSIVVLPQKRRTTAGQVSQTTPDARRSATLITTIVHATTCEKTHFLSWHSHADRNITTRHHRRRPRRPPYKNCGQGPNNEDNDRWCITFLLVESVGIGVTSSILPIRIPARASARSALCAPGPGVFVPVPPVARSLM
jgi:hypothetical protein